MSPSNLAFSPWHAVFHILRIIPILDSEMSQRVMHFRLGRHAILAGNISSKRASRFSSISGTTARVSARRFGACTWRKPPPITWDIHARRRALAAFGAGLPPGRVHHSPVVRDSSRGKSGPNGWAASSAFRNSLISPMLRHWPRQLP